MFAILMTIAQIVVLSTASLAVYIITAILVKILNYYEDRNR